LTTALNNIGIYIVAVSKVETGGLPGLFYPEFRTDSLRPMGKGEQVSDFKGS
jgi:hypothetical protein